MLPCLAGEGGALFFGGFFWADKFKQKSFSKYSNKNGVEQKFFKKMSIISA